MLKRSALSMLSLPLLLAACGGVPMTPSAEAEMVKLHLGLTGSAKAVTPQGLPTGNGFVPGGAYLKVKIADSKGQLVTFNQGVYAPGGEGDAFLTLNMANGFGADVLLPKGQYSFETVAKDGMNEATTTGTLLAYSKSGLTTVDAETNAVRLTVHTVMNPAATALNFALPTDVLYTNDVVDLRLNVKTHAVNGSAYGVPTTDFSIGGYVATHGTLDLKTASKLGVTVTATGTTAEPSVTVKVPVTGWVQNGAETASQQTVDVTFTHAISSGTMTGDVTAPTASVSTATAYTGGTATLTGTAEDEGGQVAEARVFDGTTLIASSVAKEQGASVSALTFDEDNTWRASWMPTTVGARNLTLIVSDAAGNETRVEKTVTVSDAVVVTPSADPASVRYTLKPGETRKFLYDGAEVPEGANAYQEQYIVNPAYWNGDNCSTDDRMEVTAVSAKTGAPVVLSNTYGGCYDGLSGNRVDGVDHADPNAFQNLIFTVTNTSSQDFEINTYFYQSYR